MKLSEIVAYRNQLRSIDHTDQVSGALGYFNEVEHIVTSHQLQISNRSEDLQKIISDIQREVSKFKLTIDETIQQIESIIADRESEYYQESSKIYFEQSCFDSLDLILNRRLKITYENKEMLMGAVRAHNSWRVPGMIIRPGLEDFIEDLVPLDPLYIVDSHQELMRPSVEKFTPEYQRRLRKYVITETHDNKIFEQLPDGQFGLIFAYNYFNFKPVEVIKRYLQELFVKLRPGGGLVFTFNDSFPKKFLRG